MAWDSAIDPGEAERWSDEEALQAADLVMPDAQDQRLSDLFARRRSERLGEEEQNELFALMKAYERGLLRKAHGLREAVRRGLRPPVRP